MNEINVRQNTEKALSLIKASSAAYGHIKRYEAARYSGSFLLAAASVYMAAAGNTSSILVAAGVAWALTSSILLAQLAKRWAVEGALLQEQFDTHVYGMSWKPGRKKVEPERIHTLSLRYVGPEDEIRDWYPEVSSLPVPFAILICQRSNVAWDIQLRRRWRTAVEIFLATWSCGGVLVGILQHLTVLELILRWYAPSAGLLLLAWETVRTQQSIIADRTELCSRISTELEWVSPNISKVVASRLNVKCREVQDGIYLTRAQTSAVPQFFYKYFRPADQSAMQSAAEDISGGSSPS